MNQQPGAPETGWYRLTVEEVVAHLHTDAERGLAVHDAAERLRESGPNALAEGHRRTLPTMFFGQFADFMILVLLAAALISGFIGEPMDTIAILVILVLNAVIGAVQEFRAERAVAAPGRSRRGGSRSASRVRVSRRAQSLPSRAPAASTAASSSSKSGWMSASSVTQA